MENQVKAHSQKEVFANWLWKKDKINESYGVKAQAFFNEIFACLFVFFGYMWFNGTYKFQVDIEGDVTFIGSFILYVFVVYMFACLASWVISLIIDCFFCKEIVSFSSDYPQKPKFHCY